MFKVFKVPNRRGLLEMVASNQVKECKIRAVAPRVFCRWDLSPNLRLQSQVRRDSGKKVVSPGDDLHGSLSKRKDGNNKKTYIELKCQNEIKDRDGYANHYKSL
jgi:hypothetical protein